jgi:pyrroloquinoline quinone biosynthesis protein E
MSRYKFEFSYQVREDNRILLKALKQARVNEERKLLKVYIELCTRCPGNCKHCYFSEFKNTNEFLYDEIIKMLKAFREYGIKSVTYAGGDPILRDDIFDIIQFASNIGLMQTFCTRGWEEYIDKTNRIARTNIQHIQFSADPTLSNTNIDNECKRIEKINSIVSHHNIHISWVITLSNDVVEHLPRLCSSIEKSGGKEIRLHRIVPWGNILNYTSLIPTNEQFENALQEFVTYFLCIIIEGICMLKNVLCP